MIVKVFITAFMGMLFATDSYTLATTGRLAVLFFALFDAALLAWCISWLRR